MEQRLSCEAYLVHLVKKISVFFWTPKFHCRIIKYQSNVLILSSLLQPILPHSTSCRCFLILSCHLCRVIPSRFIPYCFPTKTLYTALSFQILATCLAHLIFLDFMYRLIMGEEYRTIISLVILSLLGPDILLKTIYSNNLSLRSYLSVTDQVSHTYKTTRKFLYIFIFTVTDSKLEEKRFSTE